MTVEMKVPAHSGKKAYEETSTLYEQKKGANIFKSDFGYGALEEAKKKEFQVGDPNGINVRVHSHSGDDFDGDKFHVNVYVGNKKHPNAEDKEYHTSDLHDGIGVAKHMARSEEFSELHKHAKNMHDASAKGDLSGKIEHSDKYEKSLNTLKAHHGVSEDGTMKLATHAHNAASDAFLGHKHGDTPEGKKRMGMAKLGMVAHEDTVSEMNQHAMHESTAAARTVKGKKQDGSCCGKADCSCDAPKKFSAPTGLTGPLASMFGVHTQAAPAVPMKHDNDRTKPETQEHGKVATPDDLAVKLHSSLPGMTRKAISLNHIIAALKAGVQAADIQRMSHSAVGRKHIRHAGGSPYNFSEQVSEMMNAWTIELVQEGSSHKFIVRDEEDIIAEGVNLTTDAAMKSAARSIEELGASLEEQAIALSEEKEHEASRPSRIMEAVRSLVTK